MNALSSSFSGRSAEGGTRHIAMHRCTADPRLEYFAWLPADVAPGTRPLVLVHGISRNAIELVVRFIPEASRHGVPLIAPLFAPGTFDRYQQLGKSDFGMSADKALIAMVDDAATRFGTAREFALFGFSGGAQFVHRFALVHPARVTACLPVSAGWYCWPDPELAWPKGWKGLPGKTVSPALAEVPFHVIVGSRDTVRDDALRCEAAIDAVQGLHRKARARAWFKAMRRAGLNRAGSLTVLARSRHSFASAERNGLVATVFEKLGYEGEKP